jgi:hypothetical protein
MSPSRDPEALLRELAEERIPPEPAELAASRRQRVVEALGRGIRDIPRLRERRIRRARWLVAVAAAVVLAIGFTATGFLRDAGTTASAPPNIAAVQAVTGTLVMSHGGRARVVAPGEQPDLTAGDAVSTAADGTARLRTERSVVNVAPSTRLQMMGASLAEERMHLTIGRIDLRVEPRPNTGRIVVVETPNSEVVVHGTVFSVSVDSKAGVDVTRVRVEEGAVSVLHQGERALIATGQEWSSAKSPKPVADAALAPRATPDAATPDAATATAATPARQSTSSARSKVRDTARRVGRADAVDASTLGEENRMFSLAVEARNRGDDRGAVELFGAMLAKYPAGKLSEEVRIERMRALARLGEGAKAAAEARRYLARHPSGFARDEARTNALGDSGSRATP